MQRAFGLIIGLMATLGFGAGSASANPIQTPLITTPTPAVAPSTEVTITLTGFVPGSVVRVTVTPSGATVGIVTMDANGTGTLTFTGPAATGSYAVTASGPDAAPATLSLTVVADDGGTPMPTTGSGTVRTLQIGASAVLVGSALLGLAAIRRRRPTRV